MTRELGNDELGEIGEDKFKSLCSLARLVASKSTQDKMGWDYIVEIPIADVHGKTLDQRRLGPSVRIQVKTIGKRDADRVTLSLSAAERLAKSSEPSFICALVADTDATGEVEIASASLIPMLDDNLARVLKRLRKAHADPLSKELNKLDITFSASGAGEGFAVTGAGLRAAIEAACGPDGEAHRAKKAKQFDELGYEKGRFQLNVELRARSEQELSDAMIGLRSVELAKFESNDIRFGIPVPVNHLYGEGRLFKAVFKPLPIAMRTVRVRGMHGGSPATFDCEIVIGPQFGVPAASHRLIVRGKLFSLEFRGEGTVTFAVDGAQVEQAERTLDEWIQFLRRRAHLAGGGAVFEIEGEMATDRESVTITSSPDPGAQRRAEAMGEVLSQAKWVCDEAGVRSAPLSLADIIGAQPELELCSSRRTGLPGQPMSFELDPALATEAHRSPLDTLFLIAVDLGVTRVACAAVVTYAGPADDGRTWTETASRVARCSDIAQTDEAFRRFVQTVSRQLDIPIAMEATRAEQDDLDEEGEPT